MITKNDRLSYSVSVWHDQDKSRWEDSAFCSSHNSANGIRASSSPYISESLVKWLIDESRGKAHVSRIRAKWLLPLLHCERASEEIIIQPAIKPVTPTCDSYYFDWTFGSPLLVTPLLLVKSQVKMLPPPREMSPPLLCHLPSDLSPPSH